MNFVDTVATKEYDLNQNKTLILDQILNQQLYISIFGSN